MVTFMIALGFWGVDFNYLSFDSQINKQEISAFEMQNFLKSLTVFTALRHVI